MYDEVVRLGTRWLLGRHLIEAMVTWIRDDLEYEHGAKYFDKTWSLDSCFGRWPNSFWNVWGVNYERGHRGRLEI